MVGAFKRLFAPLLYYTRVLEMIQSSRKDCVTVLCYHRVFRDPKEMSDYVFDGMTITEDSFASQVRVLAREFNVVPLNEAAVLLRDGKPIRPRTVVITFDDGYVDNYRYAFPILRDAGVPATFFINTDYIGRDDHLWFDKIAYILETHLERPEFLAHLDAQPSPLTRRISEIGHKRNETIRSRTKEIVTALKRVSNEDKDRFIDEVEGQFPYDRDGRRSDLLMTWEMAAEMLAGGMEFGGHGRTHAILTKVSRERAEEEIRGSKEAIEERLGVRELSFCYPNGNCDEGIETLVRDLGFTCSCGGEIGVANTSRDPLFSLKRIAVTENFSMGFFNKSSKALFMAEMTGIFNQLLLRNVRKRIRVRQTEQ